MAKPKKRKHAGPAEHASVDTKTKSTHVASEPSADTPDTPTGHGLGEMSAPIHLPNAATLLDEVQQRCESLRDWQREAQASLQERARVIERREKEIDETQKQVEIGRSRLELDQDAQKRARLMLDKERAQHEQSMQALEAERIRLERARGELNDQKQELQSMREEMDTEWASLARIRRAQESLAAAMDNERTRMQDLKLADSPAGPDVDDSPGLSLTQAA